MSLGCYACEHPKVDELDRLLCEGHKPGSLSAQFQLDGFTIRNHQKKHLSVKLQEVIKLKRLKPLTEYLNEMRARGETVLRQAVPCQELDGVDDPSAEPVPLIDWEKTPLNEIANFFKSQVLLNELIGRATGEITDGDNNRTPGVKLTIMLPDKVEAGGEASELKQYRQMNEPMNELELNHTQHWIEGKCLSIDDVTSPVQNQQLTLDLD